MYICICFIQKYSGFWQHLFVSWTIRTINNEKTATGMVHFNIWSAPLVLSFYDSQNEVSRIGVHLKFPMHSKQPLLKGGE